ncbi:MAG: hypothetical protein R6U17_00840 [Thermoplasmata archaeon]
MEYHYISCPKEGEKLPSDAVFVLHESRYTRFLVINAPNSGPDGSMFLSEIEENVDILAVDPIPETVGMLCYEFEHVHGAKIALADFYPFKMQCCVLGDIGIKSSKGPKRYVVEVCGQEYPLLEYELDSGNLFVFHTKGISQDFEFTEDMLGKSSEMLAKDIMDFHRNRVEDSTVLVVRC